MAQTRRRFGPLFGITATVAVAIAASIPGWPTITEQWRLRGFAGQLRDPTPGARQEALEGFLMAGPAAVPWLIAAMRDRDPLVRLAAGRIVVRQDAFHPEPALDALVGAMGDADPTVRARAAEQLSQAAGTFRALARPESVGRVIRALVRAFGDPVPDVRAEAAAAMCWYGDTARPIIPDLERVLADDPEFRVRLAAANAVFHLEPVDAPASVRTLARLKTMLSDPGLPESRQGQVLIQLLGRYSGEEATMAALIPLLDQPSRQEAFGLLITLAEFDPSGARVRPAVVAALRNSDAMVRSDAAFWLLATDPEQVAPALDVLLDQLIHQRDGGPVHHDIIRKLRQVDPAEVRLVAARLTAALDQPDLVSQRPKIVMALGIIGLPEATPAVSALQSLAAGPDRSLALDAIEALVKTDLNAAVLSVPRLIAWSQASDLVEDRLRALERLGDLGALGMAAIPALLKLADEPEVRIAAGAIAAITRIDPDRGASLKQVIVGDR